MAEKWPHDHAAKHAEAARKGHAAKESASHEKDRAGAVCPGCGAANPSTQHLMWEYSDLGKGAFGYHGRNAKIAQNAVADRLRARGVREIPNVYGPIKVRKWKDV